MEATSKTKELKGVHDAVAELQRSIVLKTTLISFALGMTGMLALCAAAYGFFVANDAVLYASGLWVFFVYVLYHMCEFGAAAYLRPRETHPDSFVLCRTVGYAVIHLCGLVEILVEAYCVPESWKISPHGLLGMLFRVNFCGATIFTVLTLFFYVLRVVAMIQCGPNFCLHIEVEKRADHVLVDTGLYGVFRHPSYFGFFWRSVFCQLIVANPISFVVHIVVTWVFLKNRIADEEKQMLRDNFFGKEYEAYRRKTPSGVPFVA